MKIHNITERVDKQERLKEIGFIFSDIDGIYWDETNPVCFSQQEIDVLDDAGQACHVMALAACKEVIESGDDHQLELLGIPEPLWHLVKKSWAERDSKAPEVYGRFDFALHFEDGKLIPKCYEFNSDTPTSLYEASVVQWQWLQDVFSGVEGADQFNSIHERLVERWEMLKERGMIEALQRHQKLHFACMPTREDYSTTLYMSEAAKEAGIPVGEVLDMRIISISENDSLFINGENGEPIHSIFKLYPWEMMAREAFMDTAATHNTQWIEAPWKMVMSSKGLLAKMWDMFPDSPFLLKTRLLDKNDNLEELVRENPTAVYKPCLSREGSGIKIYKEGKLAHESDFGEFDSGLIQQEYCPSFKSEYGTLMSGVWVVGGHSCGLGIRLDGDITGDSARFLPHYFINE